MVFAWWRRLTYWMSEASHRRRRESPHRARVSLSLEVLEQRTVPSGSPVFHEFLVPNTNSAPYQITAGPAGDGNLWFTELRGGKIGRIDPTTQQIMEFAPPLGTALGETPADITVGPDQNLWFTEGFYTTAIGRVNLGHNPVDISEFPLHTTNLQGITTGSDGNIWFVEVGANRTVHQIGRITPAGVVTQIPAPDGFLAWIGAGPDGGIWFDENNKGALGRIDPTTLSISEITVPGATAGGVGRLVAGPDSNLWFAMGVGKIGRVNLADNPIGITEFPLPPNSVPTGLAFAPDGSLWFGDRENNQIIRMNLSGTITGAFPIPTPNSDVEGTAVGSDGNIWFTEFNSNKIGELVLVSTPFAAFTAKAEIERHEFEVTGTFTLGSGSDGIAPLTENVTLKLGTFSITIPAGSFHQNKKGWFEFEGSINNVKLDFVIRPLGGNRFAFEAEGEGANLTGLGNPLTVMLTIGNDFGSTTVKPESDR